MSIQSEGPSNPFTVWAAALLSIGVVLGIVAFLLARFGPGNGTAFILFLYAWLSFWIIGAILAIIALVRALMNR